MNDEGAPVCLGDSSSAHVPDGDGTGKFYCGRRLGRDAIPGSDGQCGPSGGPQCKSCKRFQFQAGENMPKQTKQSKQSTGTHGPERFYLDTSTYTGIASTKAAPKLQPARRSSGNSISVDELVERLYQANDKREQKLNTKREEINKAEIADLTYQPKLNPNSIVLAGGVESLEVRREKITQKREEKLEKARARQEEIEENEITGQPCITSKGSRVQRGYEARMGWDEHKQYKIMQKQHQRHQEQLQECTFQPNVGPQSRRIAQRRENERDNVFISDRFAEVHSRLHDDALRRKDERDANSVPDVVESKSGSATSTAFRRSNVSAPSLSSSSRPREASSRSGAGKHSSASAEGFGAAAGSQPLSFEAFMRSLASENASNGQRVPGWSASGEVHENELIADSAFVVDMPNGQSRHEVFPRDQYARPFGGPSAFSTPRGTPRGSPRTRAVMMSEAEDEIFMADAPPRPSPYPSAPPQSPDTLAENALPEWVKSAVPAPPPVPHGTVGSTVSTTVNSARSTPRQGPHSRGVSTSAWSLSARPPVGSPGPGTGENDPNVMTYTNTFDDVFRIGYGGALPGTLADAR